MWLVCCQGEVDIVCGGPPCQGVSGYNMHRAEDALDCEQNAQLEVYMAIVQQLQPRYALLENVLDYTKYRDGILAKLCMSRFLTMGFQVSPTSHSFPSVSTPPSTWGGGGRLWSIALGGMMALRRLLRRTQGNPPEGAPDTSPRSSMYGDTCLP